MILSFIEIEDIKTEKQQAKGSALLETAETGTGTERFSIEKKDESPLKSEIADKSISPDNTETSTQNLENMDSPGQLFGDTFELRYLLHREKIEKERFARELLEGGD